ncbi:MAG: hypothetical protein RLY21_1724 [Planctomycetota bacterium]|jgi:hypothetical protein
MPFVQLLFDFAREQLGLFGGPGGRRVAKRPRRTKPGTGRAAPIKRARPLAIAVTSAPDAPGWRMVKPPRGIDHEKPSQRRYDAVVVEMLSKYGLTVKRWRSSLSGVAIERTFRDGRVERTIESPYPTSPLRLAIFLHEVGHHAIGLGVHKPRCLEEYLAWRYAIDRMDEMGFPTKGSVARRFDRSMRYAVAKSRRRGIQRLPREVAAFAA